MFVLTKTLSAAALGACILTMQQVQAAPLGARDSRHRAAFMLAQYTGGNKGWFTYPHGAVIQPDAKQRQGGFDPDGPQFKLKPWASDNAIELSFQWENGFGAKSLYDGSRDKAEPRTVIATSLEGTLTCTFPVKDDPEGANYESKLYCMDTEVFETGVEIDTEH